MKFFNTFFSLIFLFSLCLKAQSTETIIIGTVYNIFHDEFETDEAFFKQVDRDIANMKDAHINHVLIFPMSQWDPETKQLLWERTDYLIKKIEAQKMKFVPLMLKQEQNSHYFPIWKFQEIEGLWDEYHSTDGNKNTRENVDFADPRIYPEVDKYFKAVIERYGKSKALSFYNVWNEPHYKSSAPHVIERYRKWLKEKYKDLPTIRRAWGEEYTSWDQVTPFLNDNWDSTMPQIDWVMFQNDLNGILLGELIATLRKYDTTHAVNANPVSTPMANFNEYGFYNTDNWPIAAHGDFHGISYYPDIWERGHNLTPHPFWLHNLAFNTVRNAAGDKNYILTELFTNTQNGLALNGYLTKDFVNLLAWTALANDSKGMIYWKWLPFMRGRQSLGRGLTQVNGDLAPRGEAVKELAEIMEDHGKMLYEAKLKKPEAAILLDMVGIVKTLEQSTEGATKKYAFESNAGVFKALHEANISVDVLRADRGITANDLKDYKIIYLPFQIVVREQVANLLKDFVSNGGTLVADARTGTLNEIDIAYQQSPGAGLIDVFGAERLDWLGKKDWFTVNMNDKTVASEFKGQFFKEKLKVSPKANVLATFKDDNKPALIENEYGKGKAILSAVPLGASYHNKEGNNALGKLISSFALEAGVILDAKFTSPDGHYMNMKSHIYKNDQLLYVINDEDFAKRGNIELHVGKGKVKSVTNLLDIENTNFTQKGENIIINIQAKKNEVKLLMIKK